MTGRPPALTPSPRRASMRVMRRTLRTLAAVLAGLALVAALPAPCGCAPERSASKHADEHACCAPPLGVRAADHSCCDETPDRAGPPLARYPRGRRAVGGRHPASRRVPRAPAFARSRVPLARRLRPPSCASDPAPRGRSVPAHVAAPAGQTPLGIRPTRPRPRVRSQVRWDRDVSSNRAAGLVRWGGHRAARGPPRRTSSSERRLARRRGIPARRPTPRRSKASSPRPSCRTRTCRRSRRRSRRRAPGPSRQRHCPTPWSRSSTSTTAVSGLGQQAMTTLGFMGSQTLPWPGKRGLREKIATQDAVAPAGRLDRQHLAVAPAPPPPSGPGLRRGVLGVLREQEDVSKKPRASRARATRSARGRSRTPARTGRSPASSSLRAEQEADVESRLAELSRLVGREVVP